MSKLTKMTSAVAAAGVGLAMLATPIVAQAKEVHIKVQAVIGTQTTEVMLGLHGRRHRPDRRRGYL